MEKKELQQYVANTETETITYHLNTRMVCAKC